jgi:hypothetical protein
MFRWMAASVVLLALCCAAPAAGASRTAASTVGDDPAFVRDWNATATATIVSTGKPPPESFVYLAYVQAAVYDAVNTIEGGYTTYKLHLTAPTDASAGAAAAQAAHDVLVAYFPASAAALDAALQSSLSQLPDGAAKVGGVAVGRQAAAGIVALRQYDGRDAPITYTPTPTIGVWRPTPPGFLPAQTPWMAQMEPFLLQSASQFLPPPPPALTSATYTADYREMQRVGGAVSTDRTPAQTQIALFWTEQAAAQYNRAFRAQADERLLSTSRRRATWRCST